MFWILMFVVSAVLGAICYCYSYRSELATGCTAIFFSIAIFGFIASCVFGAFTIGARGDYDRVAFNKEQLLIEVECISHENSTAMANWLEKATEFNKELFAEQTSIKHYGNWFVPHNKKLIEIELIDVKRYASVNIPTNKIIIKQ